MHEYAPGDDAPALLHDRALWVWAATAAMASLPLPALRCRSTTRKSAERRPVLPGLPHFAPKAKRAIYLFMNGGPSQLDLFDYKPKMAELFDKDLPDSIRKGQRLTTMTSGQARFPIAPSKYKFIRAGKCGTWITELLPHTAKVVDEMCVIKSLNTEAINHDPAVT